MVKKVVILLGAFGSPRPRPVRRASPKPRRGGGGAVAEQCLHRRPRHRPVRRGRQGREGHPSPTTRPAPSAKRRRAADGSASFPALPLTGTYSVTVSKQGFGDESRNDITLRSGETATLKVKLLVGTEKTEVTVYGTDQGVRADAQIGVSARQRDDRRDADPRTQGHDAAALQLRVPPGQGHRRSLRQRHLLHHRLGQPPDHDVHARRRQQRRRLGPPDDADDGAARRRAGSGGAHRTRSRPSSAGRPAPRSTSSPSRARTRSAAKRSTWPVPGGWQAKTFSTEGYCPPSVSTCTTPGTLVAINPADLPDELNQVSGSIGGPIVEGPDVLLRHGRLHAPGPDDVPVADAAGVRAAARRQPDYVGHYRQDALQRPVRSQADAVADADGARQLRSLLRHQSQRRRRRHERADRRAPVHARLAIGRRPTTRPSSARTSSTRRASRTWTASPVTLWEAQNPSTTYTRGGSVPFTIGESRAVRHLRPPVPVRRHGVVVARQPQPAVRRQRRSTTRPAARAASPARRRSARSRSSARRPRRSSS